MNSERQEGSARRYRDGDLEIQISETKTRIVELFGNATKTNGPRRGMRRLGDIPEVQSLRSDFSELERLQGVRDDDC